MEVFRSTKWVIVLTSGGYMSDGDDELGEDSNYWILSNLHPITTLRSDSKSDG